MSNADELLKLKELLDSGILTQDEFNKEKDKVLNEDTFLKNETKGSINFKTPNLITNTKPNFLYSLAYEAYLKNKYLEINGDVVTLFKEWDKDLLEKKGKLDKFEKGMKDVEGYKDFVVQGNLYIPEVFIGYIDLDQKILREKNKKKEEKRSYWVEFVIRTNTDSLGLSFDYFDIENRNNIENFHKKLVPLIKDNKPSCPHCGSEFIRAARGRVGMVTVGVLAVKTKVKCGTCKKRFDNFLPS